MPTREALRLLERYDQAIADQEAQTIARLNAAMDAAYRDLERELRTTYPKIASNDTLLATQRKVLIVEQLGETLSVVSESDTDYYQQSLTDTLTTANQTGRTLADELILAIAPNSGVPELGNVNLEAAALQARDGFQRLRRYSDEFKDRASAVIEQGLIQGWGPAKVADILREQLKTTKSKAETLARTETMSALNDAAQARYLANGIEGVQWVCTIGDVCPYCVHRNMKVYPVGKVRVPAHPRCLPAGVVVSSPSVLASAKREYVGEVVVIQTASGKELTATPNHPVATPQGWISVDLLKEGDCVFSSLDSERVTSAIAPNRYNRPTLIEKIVAAFSESSGVSSVSMEVSGEDFHGDGEGSEVCIISTNGDLRSQFNPQTLQKSLELSLINRLIGQLGLLPDRLPALLVPGKLTPSHCRVCSGNLPNPLGFGHLLPFQRLGFGLGANRSARILQNPTDSRSFDIKNSSNRIFRHPRLVLTDHRIPNAGMTQLESFSSLPILNLLSSLGRSLQPSFLQNSSEEVGIEMEGLRSVLNRFPGLIVQDRVVKTFRKRFSGYVHNLETQTGWYFANDILTHNCRCVLIPWRSTWQADGLTDDEFTQDYQDQRLKDLAKLGQKPNAGVTPFEKAAGLTTPPTPIWAPEAIAQSRPTTLPSSHLISGNPRFNAQSFDQALEQIQTEGAAERVALFRQFATNQQIQVVVWDDSGAVAAQRSRVQAQLKDQTFLKILGDRGALTKYTEPIAGAEAYTLQVARHLALTTDTGRWYTPAGPFATKSEHLNLAAAEIFKNAAKSEAEESIYFGVDSPLRGRNISRRETEDSRLFVVYLHEMGHQVHYTAGNPSPPANILGSATDYGATNENEWFAEHFALWMLDAKGYAKLDPVGAKFIEQSIQKAAIAPLRELPKP